MPQTKLGLCFYVETGELALKFVKEVFVRENDTLLRIETGSGDVDATTSHPFYVVGRGWVAAGDLSVGDAIRALSGDVRTVTALRLEKLESPIPVYNLDVEDFHSYFVGSGVLVHNGCKEIRNKDRANKVAQTVNYDSAELLKQDYVKKASSQYNMAIDEHTREILLVRVIKGSKGKNAIPVHTGLYYPNK